MDAPGKENQLDILVRKRGKRFSRGFAKVANGDEIGDSADSKMPFTVAQGEEIGGAAGDAAIQVRGSELERLASET